MGTGSYDAVVVGAGINGLTAAARLTRAGQRVLVIEQAASVGGSAGTAELLLPGIRHDLGAAVVPFAAGSPAFLQLGLDLPLRFAPVEFAHPLDRGHAATVVRSIDATGVELGSDGPQYQRLVQRLAAHFSDLAADVMAPQVKVPRHPLLMARFGPLALQSAARLGRRFDGPEARALLAGLGAHATVPPDDPLTGGIALMLLVAAHAVGWPVVAGGTQVVAEALAAAVREGGGVIETGRSVSSLTELPPTAAVLLDLTPRQFARVAPDAAAAYGRWQYGPGACKVDYVLSGPVPWTSAECRRTTTVHVGGTAAEIVAGEREIAGGRHSTRPFVLVAQPHVADPGRRVNGQLPLWTYCHVPHGSTVDASAEIEAQIDRFAPGWRDLIVAKRVLTAQASESVNPNRVGGDLAGGLMSWSQVLLGPRRGHSPYRTNLPGVYLCSSSLPPGAGVHGMVGWHAAGVALHDGARRRPRHAGR